jgi:hypothetical protein
MENDERNPEFKSERIASALKDDADRILVLSNLQRIRRIVKTEIAGKLVNALADTLAGDNQIIEKGKCPARSVSARSIGTRMDWNICASLCDCSLA